MSECASDRWAEQLKLGKMAWKRLRPTESLSSGSSTNRHYGFGSLQEVAPGVEFGINVQGWQIRDGLSSIRVQARLLDYRVTALWSFAENRDTAGVQFLDFDVLAAHCLTEDKRLVPSPCLGQEPDREEIASVLAMYSSMIDRLWESFGGPSRANFEALAIWAMSKREGVGLHANAFGGAFAAFLYGDRDRARQFLIDLEASWDERLSDEPGNAAVQKARSVTLAAIARARAIIS